MSFEEEDLKLIAFWLLAIGYLILAFVLWRELAF